MGKFVIKLRTNGDVQFDLKAANGQVILTSQGYKSMDSCLNGIASVKKNSLDDARFERKQAKNGKPFFNLVATNGQVIGTSEENGIASVKKNAPTAEIVDKTKE